MHSFLQVVTTQCPVDFKSRFFVFCIAVVSIFILKVPSNIADFVT